MRQDKNTAIKLRKEGKSYNEIEKITGVPKSTLSNWFSGTLWSEKTKGDLSKVARENARKRMTIISHKRRAELEKTYQENQVIAKKQFEKFVKERLFIAGLMIYWGEGDSNLKNGMIRVSNTDTSMIKLFYKFAKTYLPEVSNKTKMHLILYPDLNEKTCKEYWSKKIGLPIDKFIKATFIKGRCPTKRLECGIGIIVINSRAYKEKMITWLSLIKKENITRV